MVKKVIYSDLEIPDPQPVKVFMLSVRGESALSPRLLDCYLFAVCSGHDTNLQLSCKDHAPYDRSAAMAEDETNMDQQYYPAVDWFCLKLGCWLHMLMTGGVLASLLYDDIKQNGLWL